MLRQLWKENYCDGNMVLYIVYPLLPILPPHLAFKLQNIIVTTVMYSKDRAFCGNKKVFEKLIDELNMLSTEGSTFRIGNEEKTIYFECLLFGGDYLGRNGTCGFTECFSMNVEYWCRICRATGLECSYLTEEVITYLHNKENYQEDVMNKSDGVFEYCCFNRLSRNKCINLMHDLGEGSIETTTGQVLTKLLVKHNVLELVIINSVKNNFGNAVVRLCLFHLGQSVYRRIQSEGLQQQYQNEEDASIRNASHSMCALAFVPPEHVPDLFDLLYNEMPDEFLSVADYFELNYIRGKRGRVRRRAVTVRYAPELWNQYDSVLQANSNF